MEIWQEVSHTKKIFPAVTGVIFAALKQRIQAVLKNTGKEIIMRIVVILFLILFGTKLWAGEEVYYCSIQNFVDATASGTENYRSTRFKMQIIRETSSSDTGKVKFSDEHPFNLSLNVFGFLRDVLQSNSGHSSFLFYLDTGQMYQAWVQPSSAVAFSAKCDNFLIQ